MKRNKILPLFGFAKQAKFCKTVHKFHLVLCFEIPKKTCENGNPNLDTTKSFQSLQIKIQTITGMYFYCTNYIENRLE
jgi:hypothetical protein